MKVNHVWHILFLALGMGMVGGSIAPMIIAIIGESQSLTVLTVVLSAGISLVIANALPLLASARVRE